MNGLARLIHVDRDTLARARVGFEAMPPVPDGWKVTRPRHVDGLGAWFELTPHAPFIDSRVGTGAPGVAATLETFGGMTGPAVPEHAAEDDVILGGGVAAAGAAAPADVEELKRQSGLRVCVVADELPGDRQCLLLLAVRGYDAPLVQIFLGRVGIEERPVHGDERLAMVLPAPGELAVDVRVRLAGHAASSRLGVMGVQGFLL